MNDSLDHSFEDYEFTTRDIICKDSAVDLLENFGGEICTEDSAHSNLDEYLTCELCGQQFWTKRELRHHIIGHLGQPRIILKRVSTLEPVRKKSNNTYWLDPETRGSLKLTLKKQNCSDSLKLTLKKSSESEDFTVVANHFDTDTYQRDDLAGTRENDQTDDRELEDSPDRPFENVMVDQHDDYGNIKFSGEEHNPLEENERPSLDVNEGDSGVGSDMANPSEKEDQNVDDVQRMDSEKRLSENEDPEESDALEATCRETIENLKKLGEQSSSRSASELIDNSSIEDDDRTNESNVMHTLESNPAISIISKSSFSNHSAPVHEPEDKPEEEASDDFNWNQISADLTNKSGVNHKESDPQSENSTDGNIDNAGSLLQNFLIEHQRRNQNETSLSNNLPPVETEYVSLEKLAETVNTCRVCNEKFKDIAQLDEHRSKAGHYRCNIPECSNLVFHTPMEVSIHKSQAHGASLSPSVNQMSPHLNTTSPHHSPHLGQTSPQMSTNSQHAIPMESPNSNPPPLGTSPLASPHQQTQSPTFNTVSSPHVIPPVNFEQLPAPVQQLAQQVQRMPLPQTQMPPSLPPGANTMIPAPNYYVQPPGRPPLYRMPSPQGMHYPPHMPHMYSQYGPGPYPQMAAPPQMHPQMSQMRGRYPTMPQNTRAPRIPQQTAPVPRQRMKRPLQAVMPVQPASNPNLKSRRLDVLLPDRNEDADCHIIAQQKRNDGLPVIQNVQGATTQPSSSRTDSTIHLTDSITLSVRQPAQVQNPSTTPKKSDAKAVANVLAARGITVTPAANKHKTSEQNTPQMSSSPQQQRTAPPQQPLNVTALNLNSAISIIPASLQRKQQEQGQFAVPQNKQKSPVSEVERPPRPPTVDLTQDTPPQLPVVRRGRPPRAALTCQVCDKNFPNQEMLTQHMATHRATSKLLHKCNLCPAQYPTAQALATHKQAYHKEVDALSQNGGAELALPVVDLKSPHVLNRLASLGIQSYIPLSQLSAQTGGYFGLPIITIDGARNPNTCNLGALGATSILSLGPLKHLSNR